MYRVFNCLCMGIIIVNMGNLYCILLLFIYGCTGCIITIYIWLSSLYNYNLYVDL